MGRRDRWGRILLGVMVALLLPCASAAAEWSPGPARYGVQSQHNVTIRMSDGVVLLADVHRSKGARPDERFPVVATRTSTSR